MTISTKMFNEQTIANLGRLSEKLGGLQDQVASGKKDIKPSVDPVATSKLSAANELEASLGRFRGNMNRIETRLSETDVALEQVQNAMIRLKELSIMANSDTFNNQDRLSVQKEVLQHKEFLFGLANSKDAQGQALFGGFRTNSQPFEMNLAGDVTYVGDEGIHSLPVSESQSVATSVDGASTFMRIQTEQGPKSVFEIVSEFATSLEVMADRETRFNVSSPDGVHLSFDIGREPTPQSLLIEGPLGKAEVRTELVSGVMRPLVEDINAVSALTGVQSRYGEDGNSVILSNDDGEPFTISRFQTDDVAGAERHPSSQISVQQVFQGRLLPEVTTLVDADNDLSVSISGLESALEHMAMSLAQVGAFATTAEMQSDMLAKQETMIAETISGIEDADLTAIVTELQSLIVNRDALRQVFAKVGQQSLFDLIR